MPQAFAHACIHRVAWFIFADYHTAGEHNSCNMHAVSADFMLNEPSHKDVARITDRFTFLHNDDIY